MRFMSAWSGLSLSHSRMAACLSLPQGYAAQKRENISGSQSGAALVSRRFRSPAGAAPWGALGGLVSSVLVELILLCVRFSDIGKTDIGFSHAVRVRFSHAVGCSRTS